MDALYWREPLWLLTALLPWLIIVYQWLRQSSLWRQLAEPALLPWLQIKAQRHRQLTARTLLALAWLLFSVALAGPRTTQWIPPELQGRDINVITLIDFSSSMKARDVKKSRIEMVQTLLRQWMKTAPDNLNLGLLIYAGHAHSLLQPTADQLLFNHFIDQLPQFRPPTLGNNLSRAMQNAIDQLRKLKGERHILLFSDGDLSARAREAAQAISEQLDSQGEIKLRVVGMGGPEAVAVPGANNEALRDKGKSVVSRRHAQWLKNFAEQGNGIYHNAEQLGQSHLRAVLDLPKPRIDAQLHSQILWHEWFFIPLLAGILLFLMGLRVLRPVSMTLLNAAVLLVVTGCTLSDDNNDVYQMNFAEGVDCYRQKDYACAMQSFARAAWSSEDELLRGRAVFNLGNSHFRLGDYEQASILFRDAELLGIDSRMTRLNREFADSLAKAVQRRLADIEKSLQKAQWRASARQFPEELADLIADGISLSRPASKTTRFANLSVREQNALILQGIKRVYGERKKATYPDRNFWVFSTQDEPPQQTAALFNSLMAYEVGFHHVPDEPMAIKGHRPW